MIQPINTNGNRTVGVCDECDSNHPIGEFTVEVLKEWVQWIENNYGSGDVPVFLYLHTLKGKNHTALSAALEENDPLRVCCSGRGVEEK